MSISSDDVNKMFNFSEESSSSAFSFQHNTYVFNPVPFNPNEFQKTSEMENPFQQRKRTIVKANRNKDKQTITLTHYNGNMENTNHSNSEDTLQFGLGGTSFASKGMEKKERKEKKEVQETHAINDKKSEETTLRGLDWLIHQSALCDMPESFSEVSLGENHPSAWMSEFSEDSNGSAAEFSELNSPLPNFSSDSQASLSSSFHPIPELPQLSQLSQLQHASFPTQRRLSSADSKMTTEQETASNFSEFGLNFIDNTNHMEMLSKFNTSPYDLASALAMRECESPFDFDEKEHKKGKEEESNQTPNNIQKIKAKIKAYVLENILFENAYYTEKDIQLQIEAYVKDPKNYKQTDPELDTLIRAGAGEPESNHHHLMQSENSLENRNDPRDNAMLYQASKTNSPMSAVSLRLSSVSLNSPINNEMNKKYQQEGSFTPHALNFKPIALFSSDSSEKEHMNDINDNDDDNDDFLQRQFTRAEPFGVDNLSARMNERLNAIKAIGLGLPAAVAAAHKNSEDRKTVKEDKLTSSNALLFSHASINQSNNNVASSTLMGMEDIDDTNDMNMLRSDSSSSSASNNLSSRNLSSSSSTSNNSFLSSSSSSSSSANSFLSSSSSSSSSAGGMYHLMEISPKLGAEDPFSLPNFNGMENGMEDAFTLEM